MDDSQVTHTQMQTNGVSGGLRAIFRSEAYAEIMRGARINTPDETVGALIGSVQGEGAWQLIDIVEAIQIKLTASRSGLTPGQREIEKIKSNLVTRTGTQLRIVGWYYTHPAGEIDESEIDVPGLERAFGADTQITLLADPARGQGLFYARKEGRFAPIGEFSVPGIEGDGETLPGVIWSGVLPGEPAPTKEPERPASAAYSAQAAQTTGRVDVKISRSSARWRIAIIAGLVAVAFALGLWQGSALLGVGVGGGKDKNTQSEGVITLATIEVAGKATAQALKQQPTSVPVVISTDTDTPEEATETPSPEPTLPPSPTPEPPAKTIITSNELTHTLLLEDTDFAGGYTPENGKYRDRTALYLYGQGTPYNTTTGKFNLNLQAAGAPVRSAMVTIVGLASQSTQSILVRVELNGETIFEGPNPFPGDLGASLPGPGNWGTASVPVKPEVLRQGPNTLVITNLTSGGQVGSAPYIVIDRAAVAWSAGSR